jgi:hypothetical protein
MTVACALFCALTASGCVYRFTNQHIVRPEGIETVAVEAVYDTSREVLPHELLWQSLQAAFASDGHLRLAPQSSADALVRAHLKKALVGPTGAVPAPKELSSDPNPLDLDVDQLPPKPEEFRQLSKAGRFRDYAAVTAVVEVEVWSLRTRTLLMRQTYNASDTYNTYYGAIASSSDANNHLRYAEATDARFKVISESIAKGVVRDLLIR